LLVLFIVCRSHCDDLESSLKEKLMELLGFEVDCAYDSRQRWWLGFYAKQCETTGEDINEDLRNVKMIDILCQEKVIAEKDRELIDAIKALAEGYGDRLLYMVITPAPSLVRFFNSNSIVNFPMKAVWFSDAPRAWHEILIYYIIVYNMIVRIDAFLAHMLGSIAAIPSVEELVNKLNMFGALVEKIGNGYLVRSKT